MSRTEKAIKVVVGSVVNQLMIVLAGLILPPLIISKYGSATNGLVNSVKQILNYFTIATVGLGAAAQISLYEPLAQNDSKKINAIMKSLTKFLNKLSVFFCAFIGVLAFLLPIIRQGELEGHIIFSIVLICGLGSIIEFKYLQKYKILLQADQKQYISSSVNSQGIMVNIILSVLLIYIDAPIIAVQLVATFAYVVRMLLMTKKIKKIYTFLDLTEAIENVEIPKQKEALLYKMADIIMNYAPMTIVTICFSFSDASIYSVYNTIFQSIGMVVSIFSSGFAASFGNLIIERNERKLKNSFEGYNYIYRTMSFWIYTCAALLIIPFVSVYIKNSDGVNYIIPTLGCLFATNGIFKNLRIPYTTIVDATGEFSKKNIILNYLELVLNVMLSLIFSLKYGLVGVLLGGSISSIMRSACFVIDVNKKLLKRKNLKECFIIIINIIVFISLYYSFKQIEVKNVFDWVVNAVCYASLCGGIFFVINTVLDYKAFKEFFKRISGIFRNRRKNI